MARPFSELTAISEVPRVQADSQPGLLNVYLPRSVLRCPGAGRAGPTLSVFDVGVDGAGKEPSQIQRVRWIHMASQRPEPLADGPWLNLKSKG